MINTTGRRKTAVARLYMDEGKGNIVINKKDYKDYFPTGVLQYKIEQAFAITETTNQYDLKVNVDGGGITGQADQGHPCRTSRPATVGRRGLPRALFPSHDRRTGNRGRDRGGWRDLWQHGHDPDA